MNLVELTMPAIGNVGNWAMQWRIGNAGIESMLAQ
jgi:hypothetical protein